MKELEFSLPQPQDEHREVVSGEKYRPDVPGQRSLRSQEQTSADSKFGVWCSEGPRVGLLTATESENAGWHALTSTAALLQQINI